MNIAVTRGFYTRQVVGLQACFVDRTHAVPFCDCIQLFVHLFPQFPGYNISDICPLVCLFELANLKIFCEFLVRVKSVWILLLQFRVDKFV